MAKTRTSEWTERLNADTKPLSLKLIFRIFSYLGRYKYLLITGNILCFVANFSDLAVINEVKKLIDRSDLYTAPLFSLIGPILILCLMNRFFGYTQAVLTFIASYQAMRRIRNHFFQKLLSLSKSFFDTTKSGWLVARNTSDLNYIHMFLSWSMMMLVFLLTTGIIAIVRMINISVVLLIPCIFTVPVIGFLAFKYKKGMSMAQRKARRKNSEMIANLAENVRGIKIVQAFSREKHNSSYFNLLNRLNQYLEMRIARINAIYIPSLDFIGIFTTIIAITFGSIIMHSGWKIFSQINLTTGDLVAYVLYMNAIIGPVRQFSEIYTMSIGAMAASERIFEVIDYKPEVVDLPEAGKADSLFGEIELNNVKFRYQKDLPWVLKGINLKIKAGQSVAIVGKTGSGKTTFSGLISRFYDTTEGEVLIDGRNVKNYTQESLHQNMGIVLQQGFLFSGTVYENLRLVNENYNDERIQNLAKKLGTHRTIMNFPHGYETQILEGGQNLSMGQRQIISLTRALIADPGILILDEPTSSMDVFTESVIQEALDKLIKGRTSIIIAHRLSTIRNADKIVVLSDGEILETGNHKELLAKKGTYHSLVSVK